MDETKKEIIDKIDLLLQKIYSLRQSIYLQEEMDKHKETIRPYHLVFSNLYHSLTDTLVIGITSLFEYNRKYTDTISVFALLKELKSDQSFSAQRNLWIQKIELNDNKKDFLFDMRNKLDRGHLSDILFTTIETKDIWKLPYTYEELKDILKMFEEALCFIAECYELNFDLLQDSAVDKQQSIMLGQEVISFFEKLKS